LVEFTVDNPKFSLSIEIALGLKVNTYKLIETLHGLILKFKTIIY